MANDSNQTKQEPASEADVMAAIMSQKAVSEDTDAEEEATEEEEAALEASDNEVEDDDQSLEEGTTDEDESDDESDEEDDQSDETDYLDIRDDDVITVTVDGKEVETTVSELKASYASEATRHNRVREATEARNEAHAVRTAALEALAKDLALAEQTLKADDLEIATIIPPPDDAQKTTNPANYMKHKELYDQEQENLTGVKRQLADRVEKLRKARDEAMQSYFKEVQERLVEVAPEIFKESDTEKRAAAVNTLAAVAKSYGYTDIEIKSAMDPRMFALVRDAHRYQQLMSEGTVVDKDKVAKSQDKKRVRKLRSGGKRTRSDAARNTRARKQKAAVERARKTGKVADVAATLIV